MSVGNEITRVKTAFKWCAENNVIPRPMQFGTEFKKPSRRVLRKHRREQGKRLFQPEQIRLLMDEAGIHLRAMIFLGINCAYGPHDCATLPLSSIDLEAGWAEYARPKTEVDRRCPLWPETVEALRTSLARRPQPLKDERVFFVQYNGKPYDNDTGDLSKYFASVRKRVPQVPDGGFYWLRRTFETIAGQCKDPVAVSSIMGHVDDTMAGIYRQEIQDDRLLAAVNVVRDWLFQ